MMKGLYLLDTKLCTINELINLCDQMSAYIQQKGDIKKNNEIYLDYKKKVYSFCEENKLIGKNYGPYMVLNLFWFSGNNYTLNCSGVSIIKNTLIFMKHELFKDFYEKIFISHREDDYEQVQFLIELLYGIGIPRTSSEKIIFCTSHPESYIQNGERNIHQIRDMINTDKHVFYILWYTDNYFKSSACMNEAGAIWMMNKKYQQILSPSFDFNKIKGLYDKESVWFKADDKYRLNNFKDQIIQMFKLPELSFNTWELIRDNFIKNVK